MSKRITILFILFTIVFLVGCSVEARYKVFSFILDGYPNPNEVKADNPIDSLIQTDSVFVQGKTYENLNQKILYHTPYRNKKCNECHDKNNFGQLKNNKPELCYNCHQNLNKDYGYLHGPVAGGYCNSCHHPHYSKNENLLLRTGEELCLKCHNSEEVFLNKVHKASSEHNCIDCHNAHGGDDKFIQKPGNCYKCHNKFELKYKYLHGPVAGGYCMSCHGSHTMDEDNLLIRQGQQLCFYCHKKEQVIITDAHKNNADDSCLDCHNAHGGNTKKILILNVP